ncbi:MAG: OsmC family protein [Polyangiaceae bacterium]|nr:OsmC family protein [Polyangiaceae bacterium]
MQEFPHHYKVSAQADAQGGVTLSTPGVPSLVSFGPIEFDGPGDHWAPETLLTGAIADCFVLSFRAIAKASAFSWERLECQVEGILERVERVTRFTEFHTRATLYVLPGASVERAQRLLEKAKHACLVSNSLSAQNHLETQVKVLLTQPQEP